MVAVLVLSLPGTRFRQCRSTKRDVIERVKLWFGPSLDLDRRLPVFLKTAMRPAITAYHRMVCGPRGCPECNRVYFASALDLLEAASKGALSRRP